mmetsp:Transcript_47402/g.72443  ORF Transcript_47402/g.72443 Transcript_47402/m.72443 type:complete len:90 (-) Transcript_47402:303-572(-)
MSEWTKPEEVDTSMLVGPAKSYTILEPLGVVLVMPAWNYPVYTSIPNVAASIAAGNCIIMKPSELAENSSLVLDELFEKYLDQSCYRCI